MLSSAWRISRFIFSGRWRLWPGRRPAAVACGRTGRRSRTEAPANGLGPGSANSGLRQVERSQLFDTWPCQMPTRGAASCWDGQGRGPGRRSGDPEGTGPHRTDRVFQDPLCLAQFHPPRPFAAPWKTRYGCNGVNGRKRDRRDALRRCSRHVRAAARTGRPATRMNSRARAQRPSASASRARPDPQSQKLSSATNLCRRWMSRSVPRSLICWLNWKETGSASPTS